MNKLTEKLSPTIIGMIWFDHTHVIATFHKYCPDNSPDNRQALVNTICVALKIHAQLEEEIFYPALRRVAPDNPILKKSLPEH